MNQQVMNHDAIHHDVTICPERLIVSPERLIGRMTLGEVQEFLADMELPASTRDAARFKNLVFQFGDLELALNAIGVPDDRRRAA
jgi:hypothetical protein